MKQIIGEVQYIPPGLQAKATTTGRRSHLRQFPNPQCNHKFYIVQVGGNSWTLIYDSVFCSTDGELWHVGLVHSFWWILTEFDEALDYIPTKYEVMELSLPLYKEVSSYLIECQKKSKHCIYRAPFRNAFLTFYILVMKKTRCCLNPKHWFIQRLCLSH